MSSSELHTLQKAFADCGGHFSTFIIWVKHHFTLGRANYQRQYEPILYGWFDGSSHYWSGVRNLGDVYKQDDAYIDELGQVWLRADNLSTDVWEIDRPMKSKEHPTMKPVKLCARGITNSCKKNDLVLDTFGGSGSTLIACEQTDRTCYMMELDPKYCDVIRKRYANFIGKEEQWQKITPTV
jgi:DNA modification methylase